MMNPLKALRLPPVKWNQVFTGKRSSELNELEKELDRIAEACAALAGYLEMRGAAGCGDHGHDAAVKRSNSNRNKVRKALGYTYPVQHTF